MKQTIKHTDFLVVGSGLAGLSAALHASKFGEVVLVTKSELSTSSSFWAQGGIAAVIDADDSYSSHIDDTLAAGRGYCNVDAVEMLVTEGSDRVRELIDMGMNFDKNGDELDLGLEGGHSNRRILHANGASTGKALIDFLITQIKLNNNIKVIEYAFVHKLITKKGVSIGANVWHYRDDIQMQFLSPVTILATGGYSGLFLRTTNPHTSTGDGLWLAYNVGARLKNLEFVQFHPTAFYKKDGTTFLVSEALRGEGAYLLNERFERFMEAYDKKELSARDVVSKEIYHQIQNQESDHVFLDLRHLNPEKIKKKYKQLCEKLSNQGFDITRDLIPVSPAAHYCIGGVETDLNAQTSIRGLYVCGEAADSGVHGANRLASNSLLECLVFSKKAVDHAMKNENPKISDQHSPSVLRFKPLQKSLFQSVKSEVANILSRYAGIIRDEEGLHKAFNQLTRLHDSLRLEDHEYYTFRSKNALKIAEFIVLSALKRKESRGVHQRIDFQESSHSAVPIYHISDHFQELDNAGGL